MTRDLKTIHLANARRVCRRAGFTLLELLIVITIISLGMTLMVPAIQVSRESARRVQCTNNERQFGVAFLNHESAQGAFPACSTLKITGPLSGEFEMQMHNFMVDLLPYFEGDSIAASYDREAMFCAPQNAAAIGTVLDYAICPSAPRMESIWETDFIPSLLFSAANRRHPVFGAVLARSDKKYSTRYTGAVCDYSLPTQVEDGLARQLGYDVPVRDPVGLPSMFPSPVAQGAAAFVAQLTSIWNSKGVVHWERKTRASQVTDGLAHTFMLTESAGRPQYWQHGERIVDREPLPAAWCDPWILLRLKGTLRADGTKCVFQCGNDGEIMSFHPAGVNFVFADGHVALFDPTTDPRLLVSLMTPSHGDNIDSGQ